MKNCIIAISREYGSGGRDIGKLLADKIGLPYFDKEIMHLAAEKSGMPMDLIEKSGESISSKFLLDLYRLSLSIPPSRIHSGFNSYLVATSNYKQHNADKLFQIQATVIREIASSGGCVIVGRCAGYILRDNPNLLSIFIRGKFEDRVQRAVETYERPNKNAAEDVKRIDKHRANHYELYTNRKWGVADNYDLVINTSYTGIAGAVSVIKAMTETKNNLGV